MDGKFSKPNSNFRLNKCTSPRPHDEVEVDRISELPDPIFDRISELPDEILVNILSCLSLRQAAATSVLSSRWPDLWKHSPYLNFNMNSLIYHTKKSTHRFELSRCPAKRWKYIELVNLVLQSHKAHSLKEFRISFLVDKLAQPAVIKWLEFVFARRVESLELDFQVTERQIKLKELLRESRISPIFFHSLQSLCLKRLLISGEDIKLFLHNCPNLERLIIHRTYMESTHVEVCGTTLKLKHLDMVYSNTKGSLRVYAPNLTWLGFGIHSGTLLLENIPKLVEASFVYNTVQPCETQHLTSITSPCISQLKVLNLKLSHPEVYMACGIPEFPNLNKLFVSYYGEIEHSLLPATTALIWAAPRLQEFEIEFISYASAHQRKPCVEVIPSDERCPHEHLKVFVFSKFYGNVSNHYELVKYMPKKCVALDKIKIYHHMFWVESMASMRKAEELRRARFIHINQNLQGKLPHHIQLHVSQDPFKEHDKNL